MLISFCWEVSNVSFLLCFLSGSSFILTIKEFRINGIKAIKGLEKVITISVWPLSKIGSRIKEQKYAIKCRILAQHLMFIYIIIGNYKGYLDTYQFSNNIRFKFCFYILVDNGLNVLFQICIFVKEVIYVQIFRTVMTIWFHKKRFIVMSQKPLTINTLKFWSLNLCCDPAVYQLPNWSGSNLK